MILKKMILKMILFINKITMINNNNNNYNNNYYNMMNKKKLMFSILNNMKK